MRREEELAKKEAGEVDEPVSPSFEICQECPQWDSVNGCWNDVEDVCDCEHVDENFKYRDEEDEDDEYVEDDDEL